MKTITISRQYGSGGRTIGEELAKKLGISYYDKDIIRMASEESGIHEQLFGRADENVSTKQRFFQKKWEFPVTTVNFCRRKQRGMESVRKSSMNLKARPVFFMQSE